MTREEFEALPGFSVGTKEAAELLGVSRYGLTLAAKAGNLGLDYFFSGNRLKISKASLREYCWGRDAEKHAGRFPASAGATTVFIPSKKFQGMAVNE